MAKHDHENNMIYLSTWDIIKGFFNKKDKVKEKINVESNIAPPKPSGASINHIAVVMDGSVEEIIRAENRLAALFLSEPQFVEFDPEVVRPHIGWKYVDGKFINEIGEGI